MFEKMKKITAAAMIGTFALSSIAITPAQAQVQVQFGERDRYVQRYCDTNGWDSDCRDWRNNRGRWGDNDYQRWYNRHHSSNNGAGAAVAAGIFGLAIGAIAAGAANQNNNRAIDSHVARCEARFRSYDARTDTYLGYDGRRHTCNL